MDTRLPAREIDSVRRCFEHTHLDEQFYALAKTLLWRNEAVASRLEAAIARGVVPEVELHESQLTLETVALLDLEVPNGGLLQFLWNRPAWADWVPVSLRSIGLPALAKAFEHSMAEFISRFGTYSEFRKKDSLRAYSECASEFSFEEFDSAYFEYGEQVYAKTIAFVSQSLGDFVAGLANSRNEGVTTTMKKAKTSSKQGKEDSPAQPINAIYHEPPDWREETLAHVRSLIKEADPEVVEEMKWRKPSNAMRGVPVWSHGGILCTGETYKNAVKLTFAKGAALDDPFGLFNSSLEGNTRRAIDIHEGDLIDEKALQALIRAAVALNTSVKATARPVRARKKPKGA